MFGYYVNLAVRSFKRNKVLTALMILALGLGIGASITTLTVLKLLSGDPMPQKSARLFTPIIAPWPAGTVEHLTSMPRWWGDMMTWTDAMNLLHAGKAKHQAVVSLTQAKIASNTPGQYPFYRNAVMTTSEFFAMFGVPFKYGGGWSAAEGRHREHVAVISSTLNEKLFGGGDSVGKTVRLDGHDYRVIGVLKPWAPQPSFYDLPFAHDNYYRGNAAYIPLQTASIDHMRPGNASCWGPADLKRLEHAPCAWVSLWVELAHASDAPAYRRFLSHYVHQQISLGRLHYTKFWFYDLMGYLHWQRVVPGNVRLQTWLALAFLVICILNTVGLLLAKCLRRAREIGVRRALGATRSTIFGQFMVEAGIIGIAGGLLGLGLAALGLLVIRHQPATYAGVAHLDPAMFVATFVLALIASLIAGLLPAWRACAVAPAPQLKAA